MPTVAVELLAEIPRNPEVAGGPLKGCEAGVFVVIGQRLDHRAFVKQPVPGVLTGIASEIDESHRLPMAIGHPVGSQRRATHLNCDGNCVFADGESAAGFL
jgi:hypothetical protein